MSESSSKIQTPSINPNLIVILIIFQFFFSVFLYFKMQKLESGGGVKPAQAADATAPAAPAAPTENLAAMPDVTDKDHIRGSESPDVYLVEYSDLECPFCKQFHDTMTQALTEFPNAAWVYRHYPLGFHPKAQKSAEAVECANELGGSEAFWSMLDTIYEKMPNVEVAEYAGIAGTLGMDQTAFQACLDSGKYADKIKNEETAGAKAGVQGTPGTIVVGVKSGKRAFIGGAYPIDEIRAKIKEVTQ